MTKRLAMSYAEFNIWKYLSKLSRDNPGLSFSAKSLTSCMWGLHTLGKVAITSEDFLFKVRLLEVLEEMDLKV